MSGGRSMPGALEHVDLGRVAVLHLVLELVLEPLRSGRGAARSASPRGPGSSSVRSTFEPTLPPPATSAYTVHGLDRRLGTRLASVRATAARRDRALRRADRAQPELRVERGARRVEDADDDTVDVEAPLRDLADDDVRVVAVRGHDDGVGVLDPGLAQASMSIPWPTTKPPRQSSPSRSSASSFSSIGGRRPTPRRRARARPPSRRGRSRSRAPSRR